MASGPITSWQTDGETVDTAAAFIFGGSKITADGDCSHEIKRRLLLGRKVMTNLDSIFKSRDIANKGSSSQGYGFSCGHVWMWELDCEEGWTPKNWRFWTVVLEKTWESLVLQGDPTSPSWRGSVLGVHWKDWCWTWNPIIGPPDAKSWLIWKDPDARKDWGQEKKGVAEDKMVE